MQAITTYGSVPLFITVILCGGCADQSQVDFTAQDLKTLEDASRNYMEAWLSNDQEAVMSTFVHDPVLSPSGMPSLDGQKAARSFWWPDDGPPTTVTRFESEELKIGGSGNDGKC